MVFLEKSCSLMVKVICLVLLWSLSINLFCLGAAQNFTKNKPEYFGIDFLQSLMIYRDLMTQDSWVNPKEQKTQLLKKLYDKFIINNFYYASELRIPKIIHQVWLGGKLPSGYYAWQQTWIKNHPGWQYILWDDEMIEKLNLENKVLYKAANSYSAKSDIIRYEVIYRFGGVYLDMDFECLRPFDIFHHCCDFYAGCCYNGKRIYSTPLGARPGHPILKACLEELSCLAGKSVNGNITGPDLFTKAFYRVINQCTDRCVIFPPSYFFPFTPGERFSEATSNHLRVRRRIRPESFAIHYWHASWTSISLAKKAV